MDGASSPTLDIEKVERVEQMMPFHPDSVTFVLQSMVGEKTYLPPKYSAKKIDGARAYDLARNDKEFELKAITSTIYDCHLVHYAHPFLTLKSPSLRVVMCEALGHSTLRDWVLVDV